MKGLILAAGLGTRLRPLTFERSKPMLPVANQPLIAYPLQKLMYSGITEIGIVVGQNEEELREGLKHVPAELSFIPQPEPRGLAHAVQCAEEFCGNDEFVLVFCDNLFAESLDHANADWLRIRRDHPDVECMLNVIEVEDPRAFGVAVLDEDGFVTDMEEKPKEPRSNLAIIGIDYLRPSIFRAIPRIKPSFRGELEITDAIMELVHMGHKVYARKLGGFWYDTGTFPDLINVLEPVMDEFGVYQTKGRYPGCELNGPVGIEKDAWVENSELTGPVMVAAGSKVTGSRLGPYVTVARDSMLEDCHLSHCQVLPGTMLSGVSAERKIFDGDTVVDEDTKPAK
jgi:glucose-1-phosphate thymidylyltransferase